MKKLTLFLVAMLFSALSFAAQPKRIYAYGLSSTLVDKVYTFSFTANETPTSGKIIFYDATSSELVGEIALTNPVLGKNEVEIAEYSLPGNDGQQLNWAVELSAAEVESIDALNDPSLSQFKFYLPQDVAVDNSPESDFFGRVYVANPGTASGYCAAGISVYDQELNKLGDGYKATGHTISARTDIHRLAVQPQTGKIYYAKTGSSTAIYELIPNQNGSLSDGGSSVNVISGVSEIKNANSLCFDENGLLWILNYANYVDAKTTGVIYSVDNKVATLFTKNDPNVYQWVSNDNAIAPDGLGGFWVAQYRSNFDGFYVLSHVNKEGVLDFYINNKTNNTLIPTSGTGSSINASYRGHLAYYSKEKILAFGGADRVSLFTVNYDAEGKPTLTKIGETPSIRHDNYHKNIDGIAFDYAGNLYMASATREKLFVYTIPTTNNTCEVPAKKADVVTKVEPTLTVFVNDENKGTIDVATGSYEYGTEVTLTATPKPGYKLLAWSNKATTPSITLTMDNNKAVSAYFVKEYATDPTFTIEKVWENTHVPASTNNGYQGVGWNGTIYVQDAGNKKILTYSDADDTGTEYVTSSGVGQQIAVDEAGNLIVFNATFYAANPNAIIIYPNGSTTGTPVSFTLDAPERCDFLTASGNIYSAEGGYVYFFCKDQKTISRLFIKNGAATAEDVTDDTIANITNPAASQSNVVLDIYGNIHTQSKNKGAFEYNITTLTSTADPYLAKKNSTIGGCTFELGGKEFWAYVAGTTNYSSEWQLINATDGKLVSEEILFAKDKTSKNSAANWLNVQVVDEKTAYIYQFCPTVAAAVWKVSFKENYTVSATANPVAGGTVTGADTYQEGATATLTAIPNTGYKFVNWTKGGVEVSTEATYSFPVTENVELVANFEAIASKDPRAWAYDMKLGEEGDNYTFTFKATTAGQATITFNDKDGNALAQPESQTMPAVAGENKFTIAKSDFESGVDAFWSITMDGAPIEGVVEVTDQSRGIYDFYNMMGVVVDNNTDSKDFGKIYIQQSYQRSYATSEAKNDGITTRANDQTSGIFIYNQALDELNSHSNVGIKPTMPSGYTEIGSSSSAFQRLNIHPKTGNLVFSHAVSGKPAVFAINRDDMTGDVTNLLTGVADMTRSVAHCFDAEGTLYVMDFAGSKGAIYKVVNGEATKFTETSGRFINANITIASDGRGGFWISQNRGQIDYYYQLAHVTSEGAIDWFVYDDLGTYVAPQGDNPGKLGTSSLGWLGSSSRGALAYDAERNILAQGRNGKVELYSVSYEPTITLTPLHTIASNDLGNNIDGLAFDYAGDLYVVNSSKEKFQKFTLPTADNICTVAAPALEAIRFTPVYTVNVESNNNEWGIANGGGTFEEGQNATITAVAATNYEFVNWTKEGAEVSTENPYTFAVTESATYVANFVEITKYTIDVTYDNIMGTVEGAGTYYEGTEVTLTATAKGGYVFVDWSDGNTNETRTFTAGVDMPETLTANFKVAVPRAWAYDLKKGEDSDNYTFTFTATSDGNATILFTDKDGNAVAPTQEVVGAVTAGETKTVSIAKTQFTGDKDIYWSVKVAGDLITKMAELTDPTKGIYDIVAPQGIAVDNNTDSKHFGQVYVAAATDGTVTRGAQTRGIFVYDPILNELNSPNAGYLPANATLTSNTRQAIHRVAVNPTNNQVAFAYNISGSSAIWSMNPENLAGDAVDLIEGAGITKANSLCFDEAGSLYVMDNANTGTGGKIYKIQDGVASVFADAQTGNIWAVEDNAMTPDGRGGLWIAQNRWEVDTYPVLSHVNKDGIVDFAVTKSSPEALKALFPYDDNNASYRGQCAYYVADDILAFGGNKEAVLFKVTYDANNAPTNLEKLMSTGKIGLNIDGLAFDYAGDLYVASATTERFYKFVVPTNINTCTVPAPESQIIKKEARHTVTVVANPEEMGTVSGGGTEFLAGDIATLTATANDGYRFVNWTYGITTSTDNPLELTVEGDITVTAHFEAKPLAIEGTVKRAVQIGENTVVLTHENDGTPHLYKVVDGELEAEISQEGVIARDPDNAGDFLAISDIAVTEDGKLVATNKIVCQSEDGQVAAGYKRGELRAYIWNDLAGAPALWFTSKMSSNWYRSVQGQTIAYKGTSTNGTLFTTGVTATGVTFRYSVYNVIDGVYTDPAVNDSEHYHFTKGSAQTTDALGANYQLVASPLAAANWILDGELVEPFEIVDPLTFNTEVTANAPLAADLGKTYNGASVVTVGEQHLMVAPYADGENVAGVKIIDITNGLATAQELETRNITTPQAATAAATAVEVDGTNLLITLVADATIYTFDVALESSVTIDENADNTTALDSYDGEVVTATVTRSFGPDKYLTLTLPFDMNATQIRNVFGNATVYALDNVVEYNAEEVHLQFRPVSTITAGTPYILKTAASGYDAEDGFTIEGVEIDLSLKPVRSGDVTMVPVLDAGGTLDQSDEYFLSNNALYCAETYPRTILGLRAYFESTSPLPIRARVVFQDNEATSIPMVETQPANQVRKVLKDGQLIIIRGEEMYNIQGQRME